MNELEIQVLQLIREVYEKEYVGRIKVTKTETGYILRLYLNTENQPVLIAADVDSSEEFLDFIKQELISRLFIKTHFFKGVKIYPEDAKRGTC